MNVAKNTDGIKLSQAFEQIFQRLRIGLFRLSVRIAAQSQYTKQPARFVACIVIWMDQTTQLKIEFFELVRLLNQSNLNIDQKTDLSFFIETIKGKSILFATTNRAYKIQLIFKTLGFDWESCGFSGLANLEEKLADAFNGQNLDNIKMSDLTTKIKSLIFQKLD